MYSQYYIEIYIHFLYKLIILKRSFWMRQDEKYWPLMPPLPSYGYGRERAGPRYGSLIHGQNLRDVVITGEILSTSLHVNNLHFSPFFFSLFWWYFRCISLFYKLVSLLVTHGLVNTQQDTMAPSMDKVRHGGLSFKKVNSIIQGAHLFS